MNGLNQGCNVDSNTPRTFQGPPRPAVCQRAPTSVPQTQTKRLATKRRHRPQRRKRRSDKRPCTSTIEESSSSADRVNSQRKRVRCYKEPSPPSSLKHIQIATSLHLHITTFHSHSSERATFQCSVTHSLRLKTDVKHDCGQLSLARVLLNTQGSGRSAGIRVSEAQKPGPATHARDWTVTEQPDATHRRINEAGDDFVTRAVQNLRISDCPAAAAALPAPPPPTVRNFRRPPRPKRQPREYLRCAQCGPDPAAHMASTDGGLTQHKCGATGLA